MTAVDPRPPAQPQSAPAGTCKVSLHQIRKVYPGGVEAVKAVSLEVFEGEFCVLVGPSGCGKSTILRMIAGLETVTAGDLVIAGVRANELHPKDRNIAMVFQDYALYPHMTVYENMAFGLRLRQPRSRFQRATDTLLELISLGYWQPEIPGLDAAVRKAAGTLGIEALLERKPAQLSGGQRQRVAMGRAIVRDPAVFLFDEPLSNLDAKLRVDMRVELSRLHSRLKATVVYVTHDQVEAMTLGSRIVVMDHGVIRQVDSPMNLYNHPADKFVATFIGSPTMNILPATLASVGAEIRVNVGPNFSLPLPGAGPVSASAPDEWNGTALAVDLGLRPEHIRVEDPPAAATQPPMTAEALVVEQLGDYQLVVCKIGTAEFTARAAAERVIHVGDTVPLQFQMEKAHLFHKTTGRSLRKPPVR